MSGSLLTGAERALLLESRRIILCTIASDGSPRPVPVCFALVEGGADGGIADEAEVRMYSALDEKPKRVFDPHLLARVRDIEARPVVTLMADRWDEDWSHLAWLRLYGTATLLEPRQGEGSDQGEHVAAVSALRARYPQYASQDLAARPIIRVVITRTLSWGTLRG